MLYLFMLLKTAAWIVAFWVGTRGGWKGMLLWAGGITLFLTVTDKLSLSDRLPLTATWLSLLLYGLMSFFLLPLAWKLRDPAVSMACNVMGTLGAFAIVNFTMDFIRFALAI